MEKKDNSLDVIKVLLKWRKPLIIIYIITAIVSVIISSFLPVYYRATTIFLATSPDQAMPEMIFSEAPIPKEYYGNENDIDRLLTIAESNELIDFLIDTFKLFEHYEIDSNHPKARYVVRLTFSDLYKVKKTRRDAILLSIEDKNKELAMEVTNTARNKIDQFARQLIKKNLKKTLKLYEESISSQQKQLDSLSDTLIALRQQFGIFNVVSQTEFLTSQLLEAEFKLARDRGRLRAFQQQKDLIPADTITYLKANIEGIEQSVDTLHSRIERLNVGLPIIYNFEKRYFESSAVLTENIGRYKKWRDTYDSEIPAIIIVEPARLPVIKSRPNRSRVVMVSMISVFFLSTLAILFIDSYRDVEL